MDDPDVFYRDRTPGFPIPTKPGLADWRNKRTTNYASKQYCSPLKPHLLLMMTSQAKMMSHKPPKKESKLAWERSSN